MRASIFDPGVRLFESYAKLAFSGTDLRTQFCPEQVETCLDGLNGFGKMNPCASYLDSFSSRH
jgi:hypothetical protein